MATGSTPTTERSLDRQVVLEEDEYTAALSHIIARDFFPSLAHLDATNDYLDALHARDPHLIGASVRRLEQIATPSVSNSYPSQTPSQTPYGLRGVDTPLRAPDGQGPAKRQKFDPNISLDAFQARYTSEDNSSFTRILESENQTRREKWSWAWEAQKRVETQRDRMIANRERMLIEPSPVPGVREKFVIEAPTVVGLITDGAAAEGERGGEEALSVEQSKELVVLSGTGEAEQTDVMAPKKDTRSAGVDGWNFKARNALMFPPDANESPHELMKQTEATNDSKVIKYGNTRLVDGHSSSAGPSPSEPPSPTRSRIDAAITSTLYQPKSPPGSFSLVPNLPSPTAAELGPKAVKQLMTWGTLNATPRIISQSDDPGNGQAPNASFHLPTISRREAISHKLSSQASKSLRAKAGLLGLTPGINATPGGRARKGDMAPPSWTPRRSEAPGNLTPAARRLLDRTTMGTAAARKAETMERSAGWANAKEKEKDLNRVRWTPTPKGTIR